MTKPDEQQLAIFELRKQLSNTRIAAIEVIAMTIEDLLTELRGCREVNAELVQTLEAAQAEIASLRRAAQTRSEAMREAGYTRRHTGKTAGGLMRDPEGDA